MTKLINIFTIAAIISISTGCANIKFHPPKNHDVERTTLHKKNFDKTWDRAVDWFAGHNIVIDKIEKESGLITAKYRVQVTDKYLDCGTLESSGTLGPSKLTSLGSLNITIRALDLENTRVTVNFFGEAIVEARDSWDGRSVSVTQECVSTGLLEKSVHKFISDI